MSDFEKKTEISPHFHQRFIDRQYIRVKIKDWRTAGGESHPTAGSVFCRFCRQISSYRSRLIRDKFDAIIAVLESLTTGSVNQALISGWKRHGRR
jgi:hypothetical protein